MADGAQGQVPLEARVAERHQRERRPRVQPLLSRQLPPLKPETMFLRDPVQLPVTTIRNCLFMLFRIEDAPNEAGKAT